MIAEYRVKNFLSIRSEQKLTFIATKDTFLSDEYCKTMEDGTKLLKIGIIYGNNASGKTNILSAISFFRDLLISGPRDRNDEIDTIPFLLDNDLRNQKSIMSMVFYIDGIKYSLCVEFDSKRVHSEILKMASGKKPITLYNRSYDPNTDHSDISFSKKTNLSKDSQNTIKGNTLNNCTVLCAFGRSNVPISKLNPIYDYFSKRIPNALLPNSLMTRFVKKFINKDENGKKKKFVLELLKHSDFNISDFEVRPDEKPITPELEKAITSTSMIPDDAKKEMLNRGSILEPTLYFKHHTDCGIFELPESYESRGTNRYLGLSALLYQLLTKDSCVLVDEIESSIHYELLNYFIRLFIANSEGTSQLLATTHDINLLNEKYLRRDIIWFTDKNSKGETILSRLSDKHLHKNLSPYNAYLQGKLVDLPFLGSLYIDSNNLDTDNN